MRKYYSRELGVIVLASSREEAARLALSKVRSIGAMSTVVTSEEFGMKIDVNPDKGHVGEPCFKVYDGTSVETATRMARISFEGPRYVKHRNDMGMKDWVLNSRERRNLVELLGMRKGSRKADGTLMTNWEFAIVQYNNEKGVDPVETEGLVGGATRDGALRFDLPMPDYKELPRA